ncbi:MAG: hypothetical protein EOP00_20110, partial [Pedobacter sp.]
ERPFRVPLVPLIPILGILVCLAMMCFMPWETWLRLFIWLAIGIAIYYFYGKKNSVLRKRLEDKSDIIG